MFKLYTDIKKTMLHDGQETKTSAICKRFYYGRVINFYSCKDKLLTPIAKALKNSLRQNDWIGRRVAICTTSGKNSVSEPRLELTAVRRRFLTRE